MICVEMHKQYAHLDDVLISLIVDAYVAFPLTIVTQNMHLLNVLWHV